MMHRSLSLPDLKNEAVQLSISEKLSLIHSLVQSIPISADSSEKRVWHHLVTRPRPWPRKHFFVKGRGLVVSQVWQDMIRCGLSPEEIAERLFLPLAVIQEVVQYCEQEPELLKLTLLQCILHRFTLASSMPPETESLLQGASGRGSLP